MTQTDKARAFAELHVKGTPLVLYNIWDAGSAKVVADAGASAIATGSWSVAEAQGYRDGQSLPLDFLLQIAARIVASVDVPVSIDFEGGYAEDPAALAENVRRLIDTGAVGINFEDQHVGGEGLFDIATQCKRIEAIRAAAEAAGIDLFINARTDLFLKEKDREKHGTLIAETMERAGSYASAGASGFFAPALIDTSLTQQLCEASPLPVNVMKIAGAAPLAELATLGVARVSYGPGPFRQAVTTLAASYEKAIAQD